jgi:hypothetical protein
MKISSAAYQFIAFASVSPIWGADLPGRSFPPYTATIVRGAVRTEDSHSAMCSGYVSGTYVTVGRSHGLHEAQGGRTTVREPPRCGSVAPCQMKDKMLWGSCSWRWLPVSCRHDLHPNIYVNLDISHGTVQGRAELTGRSYFIMHCSRIRIHADVWEVTNSV